MENNRSQRPNRGSNPSKHLIGKRHNGKFLFIKKKNQAVREMLKEIQ